MFLSNRGPIHRFRRPEILRRRYETLRQEHEPREACRELAAENDMTIKTVRRYVGLHSAIRICSDCWNEYEHVRADNEHQCDVCRKEQLNIERLKREGVPTYTSRRRQSNYLTEEQSVEHAIRMLQKDYGMSRADAFRMVSDLKESLRVLPRERWDVKW